MKPRLTLLRVPRRKRFPKPSRDPNQRGEAEEDQHCESDGGDADNADAYRCAHDFALPKPENSDRLSKAEAPWTRLLATEVLESESAKPGKNLVVAQERGSAYYGRIGFEHSVKYGIEIHLPDWAPPEAAQVMRLMAFDPDDPTLRGRVVYPPAFDDLE